MVQCMLKLLWLQLAVLEKCQADLLTKSMVCRDVIMHHFLTTCCTTERHFECVTQCGARRKQLSHCTPGWPSLATITVELGVGKWKVWYAFVQNLWEYCQLPALFWISALIGVHECPHACCVCMQIDKISHIQWILCWWELQQKGWDLQQHIFYRCYCWSHRLQWPDILPVEVYSQRGTPVIAEEYSIRVQHRNNFPGETFSKKLCLFFIAHQEVNLGWIWVIALKGMNTMPEHTWEEGVSPGWTLAVMTAVLFRVCSCVSLLQHMFPVQKCKAK